MNDNSLSPTIPTTIDIEQKEILSSEQLVVFQRRPNGSSWRCWFVADWSQVPGILGVGGGLVSTGVAYAMKSPYALAFGIGTTALGFLFPCIRFYCLRDVIDLGRSVNQFENTNKELGSGLKELKIDVNKTENIVNNLRSQLEKANKTIEELKRSYEEKEKQNISFGEKYQKLEKTYNDLARLYEVLKKTVKESTLSVEQFNKIHESFDKQVKNVSKEGENLEKIEHKMSEVVIDLEEEEKQIFKESKEMEELLERLKNGVDQIQERFILAAKSLEELKQQLSKLETSENKISEDTSHLQEVNKNLEILFEKFQGVIDMNKKKEEKN